MGEHQGVRGNVIAIVLSVCSCASLPRRPADITRVSGPAYDGVIFSASFADASHLYVDGVPDWTPTRGNVEQFEKLIRDYVSTRFPDAAKRLGSGKRQYTGMVDTTSRRRWMEVRIFCEMRGWDQHPFLLDDGYACNCEAKFDPAARRILAFTCAGS